MITQKDLQTEGLFVYYGYNMENYGYKLSDICGVSENIKDSHLQPLHGLRHNDHEGQSGWFLWRGEYSKADDFFQPMHMEHIAGLVPEEILTLSPGYRFLIDTDSGYRDVWFDKQLLDFPQTGV